MYAEINIMLPNSLSKYLCVKMYFLWDFSLVTSPAIRGNQTQTKGLPQYQKPMASLISSWAKTCTITYFIFVSKTYHRQWQFFLLPTKTTVHQLN